jgi:hypothetical protein
MQKHERIYQLSDGVFKRLIGVKKETFKEMSRVYSDYLSNKQYGIGGRKQLLHPDEKILLMLEYYREYRTMAHIAFEYGVSEPTASRVIKEVESVLIQSGIFSLPGKKALCEDGGIQLEYVVIDATECQVERPKKNNTDATVEKRNDTLSKDRL